MLASGVSLNGTVKGANSCAGGRNSGVRGAGTARWACTRMRCQVARQPRVRRLARLRRARPDRRLIRYRISARDIAIRLQLQLKQGNPGEFASRSGWGRLARLYILAFPCPDATIPTTSTISTTTTSRTTARCGGAG